MVKKFFSKRSREKDNIPLDLKFNGSKSKVNSLVVAQRLNDIIGMILDGRNLAEITRFVVEKYNVKSSIVSNLVIEANKEIAGRKQYELNDLLNEHVERYEYIYARLTELKASTYAMNALLAKEKLIQLHRGGTHMRVIGGSINTIAMISDKVSYDPNKLDDKQKDRLGELMSKITGKIK